MKYQLIAEHRQEYPITTMCRVLEVSVSGYYAWRITPVRGHHLSGEESPTFCGNESMLNVSLATERLVRTIV
jgi:hypothetical protein